LQAGDATEGDLSAVMVNHSFNHSKMVDVETAVVDAISASDSLSQQ
jgi:hypothetical protein